MQCVQQWNCAVHCEVHFRLRIEVAFKHRLLNTVIEFKFHTKLSLVTQLNWQVLKKTITSMLVQFECRAASQCVMYDVTE